MNNNAIEQFIDAVKDPGYETNTTYSAIVSRVDSEGVVWVNLAGSEKETPTASTSADVKAGDVVTVQWRNNKLYIAGNYSDPSAGVIRVANVEAAANTAREAANNAVADAGRARDAAEQAEATAQSVEGIAQRAESAATNAIKGLAQVEDVVDTLNWIATHCEYEKTTDITIVTGKAYYTVTATQVASPTDEDIVTYYELVSGEYVKTTDTSVVSGKTYYTVVGEPVTNPVVADIGTYYELDVTEAVSNYINTHVAVTDEGLWLVPDDTQGSNKVLIAVGGQGHTYEDAGTYIIDGNNNILAQFLSSGAQIGKSGSAHSVIDADGQRFYARDGTTQLANIGYGEGQDADDNTEIAPYYTLGIRKKSTSQYDPSITYHKYDLCVHDGDIYICMTSSTTGAWVAEFWRPVIGNYSTAEGIDVISCGYASHAEGGDTIAFTKYSHAEGLETLAVGFFAHAEGVGTEAKGHASHAQNQGTSADSIAQTAIGKFNIKDILNEYALIIGNGNGISGDANERSNALTVDWDGNVEAAGSLTLNNHASHVGTLKSMTGSAVTCATGKYYNLGSFELEPGMWMVDCNAVFPANGTTGVRAIRVTTQSFTNGTTTAPSAWGQIAIDSVTAANHALYPQSHFPVNISEKMTFQLVAFQNSGSNMSVTGRMYAVRIV